MVGYWIFLCFIDHFLGERLWEACNPMASLSKYYNSFAKAEIDV